MHSGNIWFCSNSTSLCDYLVETEYRSSWWTQSTRATVIFLMSSFFIPMLEPLMVTEIRPLSGPKRGMICRSRGKLSDCFQSSITYKHSKDVRSVTTIESGRGLWTVTHISDFRVGALRWLRQRAEFSVNTRTSGGAPHTLVGGVGMTTQTAVFSSN